MQSHQFRDFDAFAASVQGVECSMMLQNPQNRLWNIDVADVRGIQVQVGRLGSGNIVEGESHPDKYLLYLPLTDRCAYSWNATVLQKDQLAVLEPSCEFCVSTKEKHDWCTIAVPKEMFAGRISRDVPSTCRVTRTNHLVAKRFRESVWDVNFAAAACPDFDASVAAAHAETALLKVASAVIGLRRTNDSKREGRRRVSRQEIIHRSMALLEARDFRTVSVREMAAVAGVSERTLRTAFNEYFSVGPVRYLQLRRLHRIHRALQAADPDEVSVTETLVENGEWQFGRFATRYRRLFGESPVQTLRRLR